jgi:hypothetical protein
LPKSDLKREEALMAEKGENTDSTVAAEEGSTVIASSGLDYMLATFQRWAAVVSDYMCGVVGDASDIWQGIGVAGQGGFEGVGVEGRGENSGVSGFGGPSETCSVTGVYGSASGRKATGVLGWGKIGVHGKGAPEPGDEADVRGEEYEGIPDLEIDAIDAVGVYGEGAGQTSIGVFGTGLIGIHGRAFVDQFCRDATGVYAEAAGRESIGVSAEASGENAIGVNAEGDWIGVSGAGETGIRGMSIAPGGAGVLGWAHSSKAIGVVAESAEGGLALQVRGRAVFSNSGVLTVPAGSSSVEKTSVPLNKASLVLATIQGNVAGVYLQGVVARASAGSFTVHLSKAVSRNTKVAWFILN